MNNLVDSSVPNTEETIFAYSKSDNTLKERLDDLNSAPVHVEKRISGEGLTDTDTKMSDLTDIMSQINKQNEESIKKSEEEAQKKIEEESLRQQNVIKERELEIAQKQAVEEAKVRDEKRAEALAEIEERRAKEVKESPSFMDMFASSNKELEEEFFESEPEEEPTAKEKRALKDETLDDNPLTEEQKIDWQYEATHDKLTGILNKTAFDENVDSFDLKHGVLIFFDANNLKYANDTIGHEAGDRLLKAIATELSRHFEDQAYRLGGDEFIVMTTGRKKEIESKIALINKAMDLYTKQDKSGVVYSVSAGAAYGDGKKDIHTLRQEADELMYKNKEAYKKSHKSLDLRAPKEEETSESKKWKELALKDPLTKTYNKLAFDNKKISKLDMLTLIALPDAASYKTSLLEEKVSLLSELLLNTVDSDLIYYIGTGKFVIFNIPKQVFETFKIKANTLSLTLEYSQVTNLIDNSAVLNALEEVLKKRPEKDIPYDERLSVSQRRLKSMVKDNHEAVEAEDFEDIQHQIRRRCDEIIAIFMTSADFNHLFIFSDAAEFIDMVSELDGEIDFSYIYAIYPGGALYYGIDEYSKEVTDLFQTIAEGIPVGREISDREIQRIEGINTFQYIHIQ